MFYQFVATAHAAIAGTGKGGTQAIAVPSKPAPQSGIIDLLFYVLEKIVLVVIILILGYFLLKILRIMYEIYNARNLVYMQITLPRADSKLDKEKETKKDFKEKMGIMTIFYKSIIKISNITFWDSVRDFIFDHAKISMELIYNK